jgi:uroporphyrin-III C-methyltransferase/precorrin-2 dehydrogenase/sirohydrochlorin ferrochelatase
MKNFPMFLQMTGRRVLIVGGGEQAAQKARLILKTEAEVVFLSETLNAELTKFVEQGKARHLDGDLTADIMRSAILVISATGCAGAGAAHAAMAQETNTLINVVDMPNLCDAMTPSIVDRDPLVIAIGTEGCAPILGRQIKSKIETMLESNLGDLVAFAGRMRGEVSQNIAQDKRRGFWNWVFNAMPRQEFRNGNTRRAFSLIQEVIDNKAAEFSVNGQVSFVQSEFGAPAQLQLGDVAKLQEADFIYFAEGIHENILELARRDAERQSYKNDHEMFAYLNSPAFTTFAKNHNISIITASEIPPEQHVH